MIGFYIKVIKTNTGSRFYIQQGKSDTDITQQPEEGYPTREAARVAKNRLAKSGQTITLKKKERRR